MLKNIRTQNNKIKQKSYTMNHSIQACKIDVLLAITNSNPCGKCLSRQLFTITSSKSVAIKSKNMLRIIKWKNMKINQNDMLKKYRTQNNRNKAKIIYNKKLKAELNACETVTFRAIPGLNHVSELGEAVFPPAMIRKAIQNHI
jgi:superfamily II DNA helicase RecQ